ncbi:YlcI/YnfO family protein [Acidovorax facilis]|uniref:YlcI/YnfO family protein n=1 Tax=Acidovorax facilis TaxID=12917 RepID=UPI003CFA7C73
MSQPKVQHERITLRIPQLLHNKAKAKAEAQHSSLNSFIVRAIERAAMLKGKQL